MIQLLQVSKRIKQRNQPTNSATHTGANKTRDEESGSKMFQVFPGEWPSLSVLSWHCSSRITVSLLPCFVRDRAARWNLQEFPLILKGTQCPHVVFTTNKTGQLCQSMTRNLLGSIPAALIYKLIINRLTILLFTGDFLFALKELSGVTNNTGGKKHQAAVNT